MTNRETERKWNNVQIDVAFACRKEISLTMVLLIYINNDNDSKFGQSLIENHCFVITVRNDNGKIKFNKQKTFFCSFRKPMILLEINRKRKIMVILSFFFFKYSNWNRWNLLLGSVFSWQSFQNVIISLRGYLQLPVSQRKGCWW